jgi:hypothetical protein
LVGSFVQPPQRCAIIGFPTFPTVGAALVNDYAKKMIIGFNPFAAPE